MLVPSEIAVLRAQMIPTTKSMSKSLDDLGNGSGIFLGKNKVTGATLREVLVARDQRRRLCKDTAEVFVAGINSRLKTTDASVDIQSY